MEVREVRKESKKRNVERDRCEEEAKGKRIEYLENVVEEMERRG